MADLESWVPGAVSAAVSVAAAVVSTVMWFRARGERREAAAQAKLAGDADADADAVQAQVQVQQHETTTARLSAEERDPWQMQRSDNEATLYNDTSTPKYNVRVAIRVANQLWTTDEFAYVGPRRPASLERYAGVAGPMSATITWHLLEDCSDTIPPQIITLVIDARRSI